MTFDYDAVGNLVQVTRGTGGEASATRRHYDGYSRLIRIDTANGTAISFSRDANGNVLRQTARGPRGSEPVAEVTQTFDLMDRLTRRAITEGPPPNRPWSDGSSTPVAIDPSRRHGGTSVARAVRRD